MTTALSSFGDRDAILRHARRQAIARAQAEQLASRMESDGAPERDSEEAARTWVDLGKALLASGRISASESLLFLTFAIEGIHTKRWLAGDYPELASIAAAMNRIEADAGLTPDQYWLKADAPEAHRQLSDAYEAALDARFEETLRAFDLTMLADLWRTDRKEYDRLREIGRRSIFAKSQHRAAVGSSIASYEDEANRCAAAGAYYAATVMLASAAEARLLDRLLARPSDTATALAGMTHRPGNPDPLTWSLATMLGVAERAGWLGSIADTEVEAHIGPWLSSIRKVRNLLHPGRHARDRPHVPIGFGEYDDARLGYAALCLVLVRVDDEMPPLDQAPRPAGT